ncbi:MAG TPA: IPT/TIG domain-containing protein [Bryobacteraceae bacterium]|nr:IPT/TIG domain-containing protein [Bryobacteraceae bacterium]
MKLTFPFLALLSICSSVPAFPQADVVWDSSGNGLLQGVYNFREVVWLTADNTGNLKRAVSMNGTINFDGAGAYTLQGSVMDSSVGAPQIVSSTGTYVIAASGHGYISSPVNEKGKVFGVVSQGIFVASSTDDPLNDLFIAAPAGSTAPDDASFNGRYQVVEMNFPSLTAAQARDALFQLNPDGQGGAGTVNVTGYIGAGKATTQTVSGVRYSFSNGAGTLTFGTAANAQTLLAGSRTFYISPDGNFIFGGTATGYNMFAGVRALAEPAKPELLNGLFYQAGVDVDMSALSDGVATLHTYYGSFTASGGTFLGHQRLLSGSGSDPYDYTYADTYEVRPDGSYEDFLGFRNILGAGGAIRLGFGQEGIPGLSVALKAPAFSGPGVFLNPAGIVNAASLAPFTVGVSRGELISIAGTNLSLETSEDSTFPTSLGGVQVSINGRPAPVRSVSPTALTVLVPYGTTERIARIQVSSGGVESNAVTAFVNTTTPGVFTVPAGGAGYADAVHADGSPVTGGNPAHIGETITFRLTGLGDVSPAVPDGAPGSADAPSLVSASTAVYIGGEKAEVLYAGLAPGLVGIYQMTVIVPPNIGPGDEYLEVSGPDSYTSQVQIAIGGKASAGQESRTKQSLKHRRRVFGPSRTVR